ncbi:MAG: MFS transporter [Gracilimonas sp.]|nr:MFS transporter [Gracilimonas sp.]
MKQLGLKHNWKQFSLLVLINAFVGGMVGLERTILPEIAESEFVIAASFLGLGTAMVYPTFISAVADLVHPKDRAESIGVFRLWRDGGYAVGALLAGILADMFDLGFAISITGIIVMISAFTLLFSMNKLNKSIPALSS